MTHQMLMPGRLSSIGTILYKRISECFLQKKQGLRPTAWLDGLRGLASFLVFVYHDTYTWNFGEGEFALGHPYGANEHTYNWYRLPYIRLFYGSGCFQVTIFFVISGFVLTQSSLRYIRARDHNALLKTVSSAAFRRVIRIWLPVIAASLITMTIYRLGIGTNLGVPIQSTWFGQLEYWFSEMNRSMNPFSYREWVDETMNRHLPSAWTLPMEVYGSFICYLMAIILARVPRTLPRTSIILLVGAWAAWNDAWFLILFFCGMLIADYDLSKTIDTYSKESTQLRNVFWTVVLMVALWVAGWPQTYRPFDAHDVRSVWLLIISSAATVTAIYHLSLLRTFFEAPAMQYLGRLSFALYMVHINVIESLVAPYIGPWIRSYLGASRTVSVLVFLIEVTIVFAVSEVFERLIDTPSVQAAKKLESWVISADQQKLESSASEALLPTTEYMELR